MYSFDYLPKIRAMEAWLEYGYDFSIWDEKTKVPQNLSAKTFPELKISAKKFAEKNNIPEDKFIKLQKQARKAVKSLKSIK